MIIIFYPRQSLFSAHTHTTHNNVTLTLSSALNTDLEIVALEVISFVVSCVETASYMINAAKM